MIRTGKGKFIYLLTKIAEGHALQSTDITEVWSVLQLWTIQKPNFKTFGFQMDSVFERSVFERSVFERSVFEPRLCFYFSTNSIKFPVVKHFNFFPQEKEKELSKKLDELQKEFRYSFNCLPPTYQPFDHEWPLAIPS